MSVPLFATSLDAYQGRIAERLCAVAASGRYILGPEVQAFEQELADYLGVGHAIGVGNGTDALTIALRALGVQPGTEVIVPSFTFYASVEAILNAGALPVFADVDPATMNVTLATVQEKLTDDTAAILPVHLFGNPAPVDELMGFGVPGAGGRRPGDRRAALRPPDRVPGPRRHVLASSPRRTWAAWATAARSSPTTPRSPTAPGACASTGRPTRSPTPRWATTRASTSSRPRCCACCCPSSTAGTTRVARPRARTRRRASASTPSPQAVASGDEPVYHLYVVRSDDADGLGRAARRGRHRRPRLLPHAGPPAALDGRTRRRRRSNCQGRWRSHGRTWPCRWARSSGASRSRQWSPHAHLGRPDQLAARARDATADRAHACGGPRGAGDRARLRADAPAARSPPDGPHRDRPPPRRQAGRQGCWAWCSGRWRLRAGRAGPRVRRGDGPRIERRDRRGQAAGHPQRDRVRLRVGQGPAHRQLPPRARGRWSRRSSRPSGCTRTAPPTRACAATRA